MLPDCRRIWLIGLIVSMALPLSFAAETDELLPAKRYLTAHESMSAADRLRGREMNEETVALYNEALQLFQQLASDYPTWQTNLVAFRINYCREELSKILDLKKTGPGQFRAASQVKISVRSSDSPRPVKADEPAGSTKEIAEKITEAAGLERAGDYKGALELYKAVLARNKQDLAALKGAGQCLLKLGLVDEARDLLFQWCVIPSSDNGINSLLALILCHDRQFDRAIQLIEIVLNEDNSNPAAHVILGTALAGMGQTAAAIAEMQQALFLDPRLGEAHYNLACLILKKDPKKKTVAGEYYLNALKFGMPPDPELARQLQK